MRDKARTKNRKMNYNVVLINSLFCNSMQQLNGYYQVAFCLCVKRSLIYLFIYLFIYLGIYFKICIYEIYTDVRTKGHNIPYNVRQPFPTPALSVRAWSFIRKSVLDFRNCKYVYSPGTLWIPASSYVERSIICSDFLNNISHFAI